jgi:hypothetical protein
MAASRSKPTLAKAFSLDLGCDPEASAGVGGGSALLYEALLRKAGKGFASLRQGRIALKVSIYKPPEEKRPARGASKKSSKKTATSRGR